MPDKTFDLSGYVTVNERIAVLYELYPQARLVTDEVMILTAPDNKQRVMVKALVYRTPDDQHPAVGYSWMELPGTTTFTKGSELENTETSAWGRAIAALGILIDRSIASDQEVQNKQDDAKPPAVARPLKTVKPHDPEKSLIGKAELGKEGSGVDFEVHDGQLAFRLTQGHTGYKVVAFGDVAEQLHAKRDEIIGQRVKVWGSMESEAFTQPHKPTVWYSVVHVDRIETPAGTFPDLSVVQGGPVEADSVPLFSDEEVAEIAARELAEASV